MNEVFEILKVVLPACITGLLSFFVTKYAYHKNIPLNKLEVSYDRLYYPIYQLIQSKEEIPAIIQKSEKYLKKYNKYADRSTVVAFRYLKNNSDRKNAYNNFANNIYSMNTKLRRRLGYLEPNILSMYVYSSPTEKGFFRFFIELLICYLLVIFMPITDSENLRSTLCAILLILFGGVVIEIIMLLYNIKIRDLIKRVYEWFKSKKKKRRMIKEKEVSKPNLFNNFNEIKEENNFKDANMIEKYRQCTAEIDTYKSEDIKLGVTNKCKRKIDECYSNLQGKENELEVELYQRKAELSDNKNYESAIFYDIALSIAGAFIGAVLGYTIDDIALIIETVVYNIKMRNFAISDLSVSSSEYKIMVMSFLCGFVYLCARICSKRIADSRSKNVFNITMCEYELNIIDEMLKRL